jgi:hypothetical protein
MANSYKAVAIAADLADRLKERGLVPALALVQGFDTDKNPYLKLGAGANGGRNAIIKVKAVDWPEALDVLGLAQSVFTPHVIQLVSEANYAGATDNVVDTLTASDLLKLMAVAMGPGCIVEWYQSAAGTAPTLAAILPANLKETVHPDARYPLISAQ